MKKLLSLLVCLVLLCAASLAEPSVNASPEEWYASGMALHEDKDYQQAAECFRLAADAGHADAQYELVKAFIE